MDLLKKDLKNQTKDSSILKNLIDEKNDKTENPFACLTEQEIIKGYSTVPLIV